MSIKKPGQYNAMGAALASFLEALISRRSGYALESRKWLEGSNAECGDGKRRCMSSVTKRLVALF